MFLRLSPGNVPGLLFEATVAHPDPTAFYCGLPADSGITGGRSRDAGPRRNPT